MTIDLTDTTTVAIHDALRQARLRLGGVASGMVLTLVIVTDEGAQYDTNWLHPGSQERPDGLLIFPGHLKLNGTP